MVNLSRSPAAAALLICSLLHYSDALSPPAISNNYFKSASLHTKRLATVSSRRHSFDRQSKLTVSYLNNNDDESNDNDSRGHKILQQRDDGLCDNCSLSYNQQAKIHPSSLCAQDDENNSNNNIFGWNDNNIVSNLINRSITLLLAMGVTVGVAIQPPLPAFAHEINGELLSNNQATANSIQSTSIISSADTTTSLGVKFNDDIINKSQEGGVDTTKISMGVKMEYDEFEIEQRIQDAAEQQKILQQKQSQEEQKKEQIIEKEGLEKEKSRMAEDKVASAAAVSTTKTVKIEDKQLPSTPPLPVQTKADEKQLQTPPPPPPPIVNAEKEQLTKMLREVSTTATKTKSNLPSLSQQSDNSNKDDVIKETNNGKSNQQPQLFQIIGATAIGAGFINLFTTNQGTGAKMKKKSSDRSGKKNKNISSFAPPSSVDRNNNPPVAFDGLSCTEFKLEKLKMNEGQKSAGMGASYLDSLTNRQLNNLSTGKGGGGGTGMPTYLGTLSSSSVTAPPPSSTNTQVRSPTPPPLARNDFFNLLENDLQQLDQNLESLESELNDLDVDFDALSSSDDASSTAVAASAGSYLDSLGASTSTTTTMNAVSAGSYLDSLGNNGRLVSDSSRNGFQQSYLGTLGGVRGGYSDQSSTRLGMFRARHHHRRRLQSTRLYLSQPSDHEEEPSMFPATSALVEILRRKKMEKDRLDAEIRAQQQQAEQEAIEAAVLKARQEEEERFLAEQRASFLALKLKEEEEERLAAEEERAREEAEMRAQEEERLLVEQRAQEEAALKMQEQMQLMADETKVQEESELSSREEEERRQAQEEEEERLFAEQRAKEEAELRAWEEEEERLLVEERAKEDAEMKMFDERLAAEQIAKADAESRVNEESASTVVSSGSYLDSLASHDPNNVSPGTYLNSLAGKNQFDSNRSAFVGGMQSYLGNLEQVHLADVPNAIDEDERQLSEIDQSISYLQEALVDVEFRLDDLNFYDIDEGVEYLSSAISEIDSMLMEDGDNYY